MAKYDAVIFDFDGTVAYTAADVWDSLRWAARRLGGELDGEFSKNDANLGLPMERIFAAAQPCNPGITQGFELARRIGDSLFERVIAACEHAQRCVETVAQLGSGVLLQLVHSPLQFCVPK